MKHLRLLSVACLLIFVCSVSLGQGITDIDRTKKTKKERKVTPSNPVINKPTQQNKKKVKRTVRKTETVFSISSEINQNHNLIHQANKTKLNHTHKLNTQLN